MSKTVREELHNLIDTISLEGLYKAKMALEKIKFLETVEYDDEELSDDDKAQIEQADEEYARGDYRSFEEVFGSKGDE